MTRTTIYGVDPGTTQSALVAIDAGTRQVLEHATRENHEILDILGKASSLRVFRKEKFLHERILVVEKIESMGMIVGSEVYETVWWAGRFHQEWGAARARLTRREVKLYLCGTMRAKDANIRARLLDYYGGADAVGTKKAPGPLYGVKGHEFAALAVAVTFLELHLGGNRATKPATSTEKAQVG